MPRGSAQHFQRSVEEWTYFFSSRILHVWYHKHKPWNLFLSSLEDTYTSLNWVNFSNFALLRCFSRSFIKTQIISRFIFWQMIKKSSFSIISIFSFDNHILSLQFSELNLYNPENLHFLTGLHLYSSENHFLFLTFFDYLSILQSWRKSSWRTSWKRSWITINNFMIWSLNHMTFELYLKHIAFELYLKHIALEFYLKQIALD